ncbi:nuclear pore complex protein NUP50A-like [Prosopis cineraria]|uniref:nuclear pore complex protein NUP50A-like n=1 Tax=Prosopis cineraria TaxID=364024 RepID=UPI0024100334|nr:nuclear pore complex protein NUP50A-like [Prosopis cineraria]XP_054782258.1 nuclear pore complex protein NUP50A-like [Prosopis cineraria]XP_054782259.1 nuclear pore complex protein NUP50A-like [Prosopis cineraria]
MGEAENAVPPSKKRAAGRELCRDTPIDEEEDTAGLESGTFKRASDEVLATRRIVKVRRQQHSSVLSSNPFAGIRLVTHTESSANPAETTTEAYLASESTTADNTKGADCITKDSGKSRDGDDNQSEIRISEVEDQNARNKDAPEESTEKEYTVEENVNNKPDVDNDQSKNGNNNENEDTCMRGRKSASDLDRENAEHDNDTETDYKKGKEVESGEPNAESGHFKSFQQLSSSQNAFTGLAGTGFSSSSFSFGSVSNDGSASACIFGTNNGKPFGLGLSSNGSSVFGVSTSSVASTSDGSGLSKTQEVAVETGEENEKVVFNADSVLFEFVDGNWKERGKGEVKVNVTSVGTEKARLLMRSRGNFRLILNARLYPDMKLTNMEKRGVTFACMNSANDGTDGLSTFALKFKDGSIVEEFKLAIMAHNDKGEASRGLKNPENSPSDRDKN